MKLRALLVCPLVAWATTASLLAHGDLHEQIEAVTAQIAKEPGNAELLLKRAELHRAHEDWAAALADYDRVDPLAPGRTSPGRTSLGRGLVLLAQGKAREALAPLDECLRAAPDHIEALVARGRARVQLREFVGAVADFDRAIELSRVLDPDVFLERARALTADEPPKYDEAARGLAEAIRRVGAVPSLGLALCDIEVQRGRFDDALALIDKLRARSPRQETWLARRGDILLKAGKPGEAADAFRAALAAIHSLPPRLRVTQMTRELEAKLGQQLAQLRAPEAQR